MTDSFDAAADLGARERAVGGDGDLGPTLRLRQRALERIQGRRQRDREERTSEHDEAAERALPAWLAITAAWAASRLLVFGVAGCVQLLGWPTYVAAGFRHPFVLLGVWDGRWYRMIATHGYYLLPGHSGPSAFFSQSDPAFYPLYPVGLRAVHAVGLPLDLGGFLLSNVAFLVGLIAFERVGRRVLPAADAHRAAIYAAIFPFSFVFSMLYAEAVAFAAVALACLFALRNQWLACAAFAAVAALDRPQGVFLVVPLAALAWRRSPALSTRSRLGAVAALVAPVAALGSFWVYLWRHVGDPLAWSTAERGWGRSFSLLGPVHAIRQLIVMQHGSDAWLFRDVAFFVLYLLALYAAHRAGVGIEWLAFGLLILILPLASGSFTSEARFGLLAFPLFWGLAVIGRRRILDRVILALSPLLLAAGTATILLRWP